MTLNWNKLDKNNVDLQSLMQTRIRKYVQRCRWYGGKSNPDKAFMVDHLLPLRSGRKTYYLLLIEILYEQGFVHNYLLPIARVKASEVKEKAAVIHKWKDTDQVLIDAVYDQGFRNALFQFIQDGKEIPFENSGLKFVRGHSLRKFNPSAKLRSEVLHAEQSNTTLVYNDHFYLKLYRRLFRDSNPDIEMVQFLSEETGFKHVPPFAASITWQRKGIYDVSLGMMQVKVENNGDAWSWTLSQLKDVFKRILKQQIVADDIPIPTPLTSVSEQQIPEVVTSILGSELVNAVTTLAKRTAEMHIHLSSDKINRRFTKQSYNGDYTVWMKNRLSYQFEARYALLDKNITQLSSLAQEYAQYFLDHKTDIKNEIFAFDESRLGGQRIRIHGDYHLGQVLVLDEDFCILDFEGEPESTIHDRKVKQSALKDVSSMFRSFHYAIYSTIFAMNLEVEPRKEYFEAGERLYHWMVNLFLYDYLDPIYNSHLNLGYRSEIAYLLKYHLLEKAIYELGYELNARPAWAIIPLRGIYTILQNR